MGNGFYRNKRVFITGHSGFKGSWLCRWLLAEGAEITGYSLPDDGEKSLFRLLNMQKTINHVEADIRNMDKLAAEMKKAKPEIVFHLAAQPLVRRSYSEPALTWETNVLGTVNLLEAVRNCSTVEACVIVTSDKCYENREWHWGYRESDTLGGHDPYSASKGAAEIAVSCWRRAFPGLPGTASARAGNVIGGGDWNQDRLVPDFIRSIKSGKNLQLRNPQAIRPWQHVLEPLRGYMLLASKLSGKDGDSFSGAWNFGPSDSSAVSVKSLAEKMVRIWGSGHVETVPDLQKQPHEASFLKLDCSKAAAELNWQGLWDIDETIERTIRWYKMESGGTPAEELCDRDISAYKKEVEIHEQQILGNGN